MREAAVMLVWRDEAFKGGMFSDEMLVVWNRTYKGWSLPGGKCEEGETPVQTVVRELREETELEARDPIQMFVGLSYLDGVEEPMQVTVFHANMFYKQYANDAVQGEPGCPVGWMKWRDLLEVTPFRAFYEEFLKTVGIPVR